MWWSGTKVKSWPKSTFRLTSLIYCLAHRETYPSQIAVVVLSDSDLKKIMLPSLTLLPRPRLADTSFQEFFLDGCIVDNGISIFIGRENSSKIRRRN